MIGVLTAGALAIGVWWHSLPDTKEKIFKDKFKKIMEATGIKNKKDQTYQVIKVIEKQYGLDAIIGVPNGFNIDKLKDMQSVFETNLGAKQIIISKAESGKENSAYMKVRYEELKDIESLKNRFKFQWNIVLSIVGFKTNLAMPFNTKSIIKTDYGLLCKFNVYDGSLYKVIEDKQMIIEKSLGGLIEFKSKTIGNELALKFADTEIGDREEYIPVETKLNELYIGTTFFRENLISDQSRYPHLGLWGTTCSGKSTVIRIILTNHVYFHSEKVLWIYLAQSSMKKDFDDFKDLKHTKYYAQNLQDSLILFKHIYHLMEDRNNELRKYNCKNIWDYHKIWGAESMPLILIFTDEFETYMPEESEDPELHELKIKITNIVIKIGGEARNVGIIFSTATQRPDSKSLPPELKKNLNTQVNHRQLNESSAKVATDDTRTLRLPNREAWVEFNGEMRYIKTFYFDDKVMNKYLKPLKEKNHKYIELDNNGNIILPHEETTSNDNQSNADISNSNNTTQQPQTTNTEDIEKTIKNNGEAPNVIDFNSSKTRHIEGKGRQRSKKF